MEEWFLKSYNMNSSIRLWVFPTVNQMVKASCLGFPKLNESETPDQDSFNVRKTHSPNLVVMPHTDSTGRPASIELPNNLVIQVMNLWKRHKIEILQTWVTYWLYYNREHACWFEGLVLLPQLLQCERCGGSCSSRFRPLDNGRMRICSSHTPPCHYLWRDLEWRIRMQLRRRLPEGSPSPVSELLAFSWSSPFCHWLLLRQECTRHRCLWNT